MSATSPGRRRPVSGRARGVLALVAMLAPALIAPAAGQDMPERFRAAIRWIEANSHYRNLPPLRTWMELTPEEMNRQALSNGMRSAFAIYFCNAQSIALLGRLEDGRAIDWNRPFSQGVLVHELTHHAQCAAGRFSGLNRCALEKEAYAMQAQYLREQARLHPDPAERAQSAENAAAYEKIAASDGCANYSDGR
jgi:hypothetical protein